MRTPERLPEAAKDTLPPANDRVVEQRQSDIRDVLEKLKLDTEATTTPAPEVSPADTQPEAREE